MSTLKDIQTQLGQTSSVIEGFHRSVAEGAVIDLTGLDRSVEAMCAEINNLPENQRLSVKGALISLIDDLNALVELLTIQQGEASEGLKGVTSRQQAVSAYGKGVDTTKAGKAGKGDPTT